MTRSIIPSVNEALIASENAKLGSILEYDGMSRAPVRVAFAGTGLLKLGPVGKMAGNTDVLSNEKQADDDFAGSHDGIEEFEARDDRLADDVPSRRVKTVPFSGILESTKYAA
jgi:hypothetical protein